MSAGDNFCKLKILQNRKSEACKSMKMMPGSLRSYIAVRTPKNQVMHCSFSMKRYEWINKGGHETGPTKSEEYKL